MALVIRKQVWKHCNTRSFVVWNQIKHAFM